MIESSGAIWNQTAMAASASFASATERYSVLRTSVAVYVSSNESAAPSKDAVFTVFRPATTMRSSDASKSKSRASFPAILVK